MMNAEGLEATMQQTMPPATDPLAGLRIAIADATRERLDILLSALSGAQQVITIGTVSAPQVAQAVRDGDCQVLILGADDADEAFATELESLMKTLNMPILVFVERAGPDAAAAFVRQGASAFIVDGLSPSRIAPIIMAGMERFRLVSALQNELIKSKNELSARKVIERAKGLLMEQQKLSESEAYDSIRRLAMARGKTVLDVSETIIGLSDVLPKRHG